MGSNKILLCIPCFNCEKQVVRVIETLSVTLGSKIFEIIVIDNQSRDTTVTVAAKALEELNNQFSISWKVIRNNSNYGLGGSHKVAFKIAKELGASHLAILHGDNQARTEELKSLISEIESDPALCAVLGARFMPGSRLQGYSPVRIAGNIGLNGLYSLLGARCVFDLGSGLNIFNVFSVDSAALESMTDGFTFNMQLLLYLIGRKAKLKYTPITWVEEDQVSNARTFKVGWQATVEVLSWFFCRSARPEQVGNGDLNQYSFTVEFESKRP